MFYHFLLGLLTKSRKLTEWAIMARYKSLRTEWARAAFLDRLEELVAEEKTERAARRAAGKGAN